MTTPPLPATPPPTITERLASLESRAGNAEAAIDEMERQWAAIHRANDTLAGALLPFVMDNGAATHHIVKLRTAFKAWLDARAEF